MKKLLLSVLLLSLIAPKTHTIHPGGQLVLGYIGLLQLTTCILSTCAAYEIYHQRNKPHERDIRIALGFVGVLALASIPPKLLTGQLVVGYTGFLVASIAAMTCRAAIEIAKQRSERG